MIALLQRVSMAEVWIADKRFSRIEEGILVFLGIEKIDNESLSLNQEIQRLCDKILHYRIFEDLAGQMNLNVMQKNASLLIVPQFTLAADTRKGLRPSFSSAAQPATAEPIYRQFVDYLRSKYSKIETGVFGADMDIGLVNDGPATFILN